MDKQSRAIIALFILFAIYMPFASAIEQKIILIPYYITTNTSFLACSKLENSVCINGTEQFSYKYASNASKPFKKLEALLGGFGFDYSSDYWCDEINTVSQLTNLPRDDKTVMLNQSAICNIDSQNYTIYFLEYANTTFKVKYSSAGEIVTDWYNLSNVIVLNSTINKKIWFRSVRIGANTYLDFSCDSNASIIMPVSLITINGSCEDKDIAEKNIYWTTDSQLLIDNSTVLLDENTTKLDYGILPNTTFAIKAKLLNKQGAQSQGKMYFNLRDIQGPVFEKGELAYNSTSGYFEKKDIIMPVSYPAGILELEAEAQLSPGGYGGMKKIYRAIPYSVNLSISGNGNKTDFYSFIKDQVPIKFEITNYYGSVQNVTSYIKYLNSTPSSQKTDLGFNNSGGYFIYNIPGNQPGEYVVEVNVKHSTGYNVTYTKYIHVTGFSFELVTPKTWIQGDNVEIFAWIEDSRNVTAKTVESNLTSSTIRKPDGTLEALTELPRSEGDYKHKFYFQTSNSTSPIGYYTLMMKATDIYNYSYEKAYVFYIGTNYKNEFIEITMPPAVNITTFSSVTNWINITNVKNATVYGIEVSVTKLLSYLSVNKSGLKSDLEANNRTSFSFTVSPDASFPTGDSKGEIAIVANNITTRIPILITANFKPFVEFSAKAINISAVTGEAVSRSVKIKNIGYTPIEDVEASISGNITGFVLFTTPDANISLGNESTIILNFNFPNQGYYSGYMKITSKSIPEQKIMLDASVYKNIDPDIKILLAEISTLQLNVTDLEAKGINVVNLTRKMTDAVSNQSMLQSFYNAKNYSEAEKALSDLRQNVEQIKSEYSAKYQQYQKSQMATEGDGFCEAKESCSSPDCSLTARCNPVSCGDGVCDKSECGSCMQDCTPAVCGMPEIQPGDADTPAPAQSSSTLYYSIIAVLAVIALIIVATSIVPAGNAPGTAGASQRQYQPGPPMPPGAPIQNSQLRQQKTASEEEKKPLLDEITEKIKGILKM